MDDLWEPMIDWDTVKALRRKADLGLNYPGTPYRRIAATSQEERDDQ